MSRSRINRKSGRQLCAVCAGLVLIAAGISLSACNQVAGTSTGGYEADKPAEPVSKVEPIKGKKVQLVKFSALGGEENRPQDGCDTQGWRAKGHALRRSPLRL